MKNMEFLYAVITNICQDHFQKVESDYNIRISYLISALLNTKNPDTTNLVET